MPSPKMEVRLVEQPHGPFKIVVYLSSHMNSTVRTMGELNPGQASGSADLLHRVGVLAGAIAERQNVTYGDNHTPEECYKIAQNLFKEAALEYGQNRQELRDAVRKIINNPDSYPPGSTAHVSAVSD